MLTPSFVHALCFHLPTLHHPGLEVQLHQQDLPPTWLWHKAARLQPPPPHRLPPSMATMMTCTIKFALYCFAEIEIEMAAHASAGSI
jgi:hypothetical protein